MSPGQQQEELPGIDLERLSDWFCAYIEDATSPLSIILITGGRSNLTYLVRDGRGSTWVLRRPPLGRLLPSAHDMGREYRILAALWPTGLPVPEPLRYCDDASIIGSPFYVMEHVEGRVLRTKEDCLALRPEQRASAARSLVGNLARLHSLDPDDVTLGDLGRREGYVHRQLTRWRRQIEAAETSSAEVLRSTHAVLAPRIPPQHSTTIVHGDYRLDNAIVSDTGRLLAVLDWELCTLGDPRADLGMMLVYWAPQDDPISRIAVPTDLRGFPTREELVSMYEAAGGTTVSLGYFVAFSYWRLGAILEGVFARTVSGAYGRQQEDLRLVIEAMSFISETLDRLIRQL